MQEGGATQRLGIGQRLRALRRIEYQLNGSVLDRIDDMGASLGDLVDLYGGNLVRLKVARRAAGRLNLEAEGVKLLHRCENARLVDIAHRHKQRARSRHFRSASKLALGERKGEWK